MPGKASNAKLMRLLMLALGILVVALIVVLIVMLAGGGKTDADKQQSMVDSGKYLKGISIAGVDVSGMTYAQAAANASLISKAKSTVSGFTYTFTVSGKEYAFSAAELGITSNLEKVLKEALYFGQFGENARDERTQLGQGGKDFALGPYADEAAVKAKIMELKKSKLDVAPQNATLEISDAAKGESAFKYVKEVAGAEVDADKFASLICNNINSGKYGSVEAPVSSVNPSINVEELKANTKLIGSRTTSFKEGSLGGKDRVTNIRIMAGFINGTVIQPGETWSINDAAGPRTAETAKTVGWADASGITNGRLIDQPGGGVCQASGTLYNAAIRAELTIAERHVHSWPSSYLPEGLDATISTGSKDLKITNPYNMPVFFAAYLDETKKTLTVEVYGPPLPHGYTVDFVHTQTKTMVADPPTIHYNAAQTPDGTPITAGATVEWVKHRDGAVWEVYKQYKDSKGNVVKSEFFSRDTYPAFAGESYVNGPKPGSVTDVE